MKIRFWGVRGSIPSPLVGEDIRAKIRKALSHASPKDLSDEASIKRFINTLPYSLVGTYGGNTTCIEIRSANDDLIIIDAGSGIRALGNELLKGEYGEGKGECSILFTHTHWDHIQGLPFFGPFYIEGNTFHIHAIHERIEERLRYQHNPNFFPVPFEQIASTKHFHQHKKDEVWELNGIQITQKAVPHPGIAYAYRFEEKGKSFVFCTDAEFSMLSKENQNMGEYVEYFRDADLLVFDAQYTFEDQVQKIDWGHSSSLMAADFALRANVKQLLLYHHDPSYTDEKLDQVFLRALEYKKISEQKSEVDLDINLAYEGLTVNL